MKTPDITPVQSLAAGLMTLLQAVIVALVAFGVHITDAQIGAIEGVFAAFLGLAVYCDLALRKHRISNLSNLVQSKVLVAQAQAQAEPAPKSPAPKPAPKASAKPAAKKAN